jgi:hypothetical protein
MISRRSLFGIGAGAAAAALVPMPDKPEVIVGMDFGTRPAMVEFEFSNNDIAWQLCQPECVARANPLANLVGWSIDVQPLSK